MEVLIVDSESPSTRPIGQMPAFEGMKTATGKTINAISSTGCVLIGANGSSIKVSASATITIPLTEAERFGYPDNIQAPATPETKQGTSKPTKKPTAGEAATDRGDFASVVDLQVDPARMEFDPEGDIRASYAAQKVSDNKPLQKPFTHEGRLYVLLGSKAYQLWPLAEWPENAPEPLVYNVHIEHERHAKLRDAGTGYIGVKVIYKNKPHVLGGPVLNITERDEE